MYWRPDLFFDNTFDWIVVVDSDDIIDCEFLEIYNKIIQSNKEITLILIFQILKLIRCLILTTSLRLYILSSTTSVKW